MTAKADAFLPAGKPLVSWLREGGRATRSPRSMLWTYRWRAYWFDANWRRQQALYPASCFEGEAGCRLIFVLGFWRSGTTLLHELLAAGPHMAAPRTWQCMNPSGFRIVAPPVKGTAVARPMDAVLVDALSPQEDEFALLARGAPSVYRTWLDPRRWQETLSALEPGTWLALSESQWLTDWRTFLGWCMPATASHLVIKSPNHVFRLRALQRVWPRARAVWTLRDPIDTWHSNRRMWRAMAARYGLWEEASAEDLDRFLFKAMSEYAGTLRWVADTPAARDAIYVDFDGLTNDTERVLHHVTRRLQLGSWRDWLPLLRPRLTQSASYPQAAYQAAAPLPAYANTMIVEIRELHRRMLDEQR